MLQISSSRQADGRAGGRAGLVLGTATAEENTRPLLPVSAWLQPTAVPPGGC